MSNIKGRVVDYDTDGPVAAVLVSGISGSGTLFAEATTNAEGEYNLNHIGFDDLYSQIRFSKNGYATQTMRPASANNVDVVLPKSNTLAAVTITLKQNKPKIILFLAIGIALTVIYFKYFKNKI